MVEKIAKPIEKKWFDVKLECMLPATLTYRILAENPEQALELMKHAQPIGVKHKLAGKKSLKATVLDAGSSMVRYVVHMVK